MDIFRKFIIFLYIIISLFGKSIQTTNINFNLPNAYTLLDNTNLFVAEDGIHFFNEELSEEFPSKKINLSISLEDMKKLLFAQFSNEDYPYILLFVQRRIYIFNDEKSKLKDQEITYEIMSNEIHLKLIP